jgi:hypothetical protein
MAFPFRLETAGGAPAEPSTLKTAVPNWRPGDTTPLERDRTLRVVDVHDDEADEPLSGPSALVLLDVHFSHLDGWA